MTEPIKIRLNPELVAAARDFNRQVAAIDWGRIHDALLYALFNGGNLPPGFMEGPNHPSPAPSPVSAATGETGEETR